MSLSFGTLQTYASGGVFVGINSYPSDGLFGNLLIAIACLTFTPYKPAIALTFQPPPVLAASFIPSPTLAATFASPVVTATWLSVLSSVTFTPSPIAEATFYDHHSACAVS